MLPSTSTFLYLHPPAAICFLSMKPAGERVQDFQVALKRMIHASPFHRSAPTFIKSGLLHHVASHQGQICHFTVSYTPWKQKTKTQVSAYLYWILRNSYNQLRVMNSYDTGSHPWSRRTSSWCVRAGKALHWAELFDWSLDFITAIILHLLVFFTNLSISVLEFLQWKPRVRVSSGRITTGPGLREPVG